MGRPNYELKAYVLGTELPSILNRFHKRLAFDEDLNMSDIIDFNNYLYTNYSIDELKEGERIINSNYHRISRLKTRIGEIITKPSLFLTLTFTDRVLQDTSEETRRKYVIRFLKRYSNNYVANIDFGSKHGREHYHAVIQCDHVDHDSWIYGAINFKTITYDDKSSTKLSKYVSKLTNHAIKCTTKRNYIIYSKKS